MRASRLSIGAAAGLAVTTIVAALAHREAPTTPATPVAAHGRLEVCGVHLCDQAGEPVQLRGISSHGLQLFPDCVNRHSLAALRSDWTADVVRLSMYAQQNGLETDPAGWTATVNNLIDQASSLGLYVIVDFHVLDPGDPLVNLDLARTFFADVSAAQAGRDNVLYEIANEPNGVAWQNIREYAEQVVPVIRRNDPDSVVLVGTRGFSSLGLSEGADETEILDDPVRAANIMYTFHFYAASHGADRRQAVARASRRLPLFVSEFGTQTYTGTGGNDLAGTDAWLDLLAERKIGYAMWSLSDGADTNSALRPGTCDGTDYTGDHVLTESGRYLRDRIRSVSEPAPR